jgi:hypothetical protein
MEPITRDEMLLDGQDLTPITRKEMFLKRLYDKTQEVPEPITREEWFLKKAAEGGGGGDITVESLSVTENGTYTAPSGKAYSPVTVEVEPPEDSYQLKSITTPTSLATFEASAMPMPSLKVSVEAKQDLHGYDKPWVGGAGKNKIHITLTYIKYANQQGTWNGNTYTNNGLTYVFEANQDDCLTKITVNGKASKDTALRLYSTTTYYSDGTYIVSGLTGGSWNTYQLEFVASDYSRTVVGPKEETLVTDNIMIVELTIRNNATISNLIVQPMVRLSTEDSTFAPYSNICPISGWDAANVSDVDDVDNPTVTQTTTISLPQTVYGGELDVVNGTSGNKLTYRYFEISNFDNWNYQEYANFKALYKSLNDLGYPPIKDASDRKAISDKFKYIAVGTQQPFGTFSIYTNGNIYFWNNDNAYANKDEMIAALNNIKPAICYELATPTTFETQPTPIKSLNGQNNLSVDCGDVIEGEYFIALGGE